MSTGLRRGELLGLDWDAVDMEQHTVKVARQVLVRPRATPSEPRVIIRETTKTRRTRLVRFDETTAVALRGWKAAQAADKLRFGPAYRSDGGLGVEAPWLVTEPNGYVVAPETFLGRWQRLVKDAGVPAIGIHGARHSFASLSLEAGVRLDIVSGQLGHSNVATTANIYAHVSEAAAVDAAEKLGQILEGGPDDGRGEIPGTRRPLVRAVGERGPAGARSVAAGGISGE